MLDRIVEVGLDAVELGCGNYPGDWHCSRANCWRTRFVRPLRDPPARWATNRSLSPTRA
jgi:hypothetical protein